ncbi:8917_t:CDS:2 [Rhizophagus irregularis]|nr:8917_t:CDS:2 [Rhizophagus irregularis]
MGLCREAGNIDETKLYGIMPFVLRRSTKKMKFTEKAMNKLSPMIDKLAENQFKKLVEYDLTTIS